MAVYNINEDYLIENFITESERTFEQIMESFSINEDNSTALVATGKSNDTSSSNDDKEKSSKGSSRFKSFIETIVKFFKMIYEKFMNILRSGKDAIIKLYNKIRDAWRSYNVRSGGNANIEIEGYNFNENYNWANPKDAQNLVQKTYNVSLAEIQNVNSNLKDKLDKVSDDIDAEETKKSIREIICGKKVDQDGEMYDTIFRDLRNGKGKDEKEKIKIKVNNFYVNSVIRDLNSSYKYIKDMSEFADAQKDIVELINGLQATAKKGESAFIEFSKDGIDVFNKNFKKYQDIISCYRTQFIGALAIASNMYSYVRDKFDQINAIGYELKRLKIITVGGPKNESCLADYLDTVELV